MSRPPAPLPRLYRWRTNLIQAPLFFLVTGVCGTLALAASLFDRRGQTQHRIARAWGRLGVWATGSTLRVRRIENLKRYQVAVYAANHTSYMDTPVVFASLPFQFRILARKELWSWPFIGWYLARSGQISIDTTNAHTTLSSLGAGVKALRAGMPLFVFPEGARTPTGELQGFQSGAAYLAIRAQVPLVPVALSGVYDLLPIHTRHFYPSELVLTAGEPIATAGMHMRQAEELTERLKATIEELQREAAPAAADGLACSRTT
jgi:1-acyl-sn-glycerol-3-phosphate acyltransferase